MIHCHLDVTIVTILWLIEKRSLNHRGGKKKKKKKKKKTKETKIRWGCLFSIIVPMRRERGMGGALQQLFIIIIIIIIVIIILQIK